MTAAPTRPAEPSVLDAVSSIIPKTVEISRNVIFGEIWERPGLSKRDRSLITVATLLAQGSVNSTFVGIWLAGGDDRGADRQRRF